jgi:Fic family protein
LDGAASVLPNVDLFIQMYVFQEATVSSQIEGTQASLGDVVGARSEAPPPERRDAIDEIENYIAALNFGIERLQSLPVSLRLVREIHEVLMTDMRGGESTRTPGEFRRSQNWIGGTTPTNARFVPPPVDEMQRCLDEWERSVHVQTLPPLVHIGMLHAQFETIHPFLDGNGRVGRLLVTFLLTEREILARPLLYLSIYFKKHQDEYYDRLQAVRDHGDWEGWLAFFIEGVRSTARSATHTVRTILDLRDTDRERIRQTLGRRASNGLRLHDYLFENAVVNARRTQEIVRVSQPTANRLLRDLEEAGILREWTGRQRGQSWVYADYFQIFAEAELLAD